MQKYNEYDIFDDFTFSLVIQNKSCHTVSSYKLAIEDFRIFLLSKNIYSMKYCSEYIFFEYIKKHVSENKSISTLNVLKSVLSLFHSYCAEKNIIFDPSSNKNIYLKHSKKNKVFKWIQTVSQKAILTQLAQLKKLELVL